MQPSFSVKFENPEYPDEIWAADWNWRKEGGWGISRSPAHKVSWEIVKDELDELARRAILKKFGLDDCESEFPINFVNNASPAFLIKCRRFWEEEHHLPELKVATDNFCYTKEGPKRHYAEEYE